MEFKPNCAICNSPALPECPCEGERLALAIRQAQNRALEEKLQGIRDWVLHHARSHILQVFNIRASHRHAAHKEYLASLRYYDLWVRYRGNPPLHTQQLQILKTQIREAERGFKVGIDRDWKESVHKYPEVLDYFFSLVDIRIPSDRSSSVLEPQFGVVAGGRDKWGVRERRAAPPVAPAVPPPGGYPYRY